MAVRVIRVAEIASTKARPGLLPVSAATVWRWAANSENDFPKPFKLSDSVTVWDRESVEKWIAGRAGSVTQ